MSAPKKSGVSAKLPAVVGTIHSPESLKCALGLRPAAVDYFELRVDAFTKNPETLLEALPRLPAPLIITARHPAEGGANKLTILRRRELYALFVPFARFIDIELRSFPALADTAALARQRRVGLIASAHYFRSTPRLAKLQQLRQQARRSQAEIFKVAAFTSTLRDLAQLFGLFVAPGPLPVSAMGMGKYGRISRLLFPRAGSVLNYGYLSSPQISGQWEATVLKSRIAEVATE